MCQKVHRYIFDYIPDYSVLNTHILHFSVSNHLFYVFYLSQIYLFTHIFVSNIHSPVATGGIKWHPDSIVLVLVLLALHIVRRRAIISSRRVGDRYFLSCLPTGGRLMVSVSIWESSFEA